MITNQIKPNQLKFGTSSSSMNQNLTSFMDKMILDVTSKYQQTSASSYEHVESLSTLSTAIETSFNDIRSTDTTPTDVLETFTPVVDPYVNITLGMVFLVSTLCNSLLILVFYRRPGLRSISNKFVLNLLVVNLLSTWTLLPMIFYDNYRYDYFLSDLDQLFARFFSSLIEGVSTGVTSLTVLSVVLIGIDQYFAVLEPLRYHSIMNSRQFVKLIIIVWVCASLCGALGTFNSIFGSVGNESIAINGSLAKRDEFNNNGGTYYGSFGTFFASYSIICPIIFSLVIFLLPFLILCYIYLSIYWAAHENSLRTRNHCSSTIFTETSHSELRASRDSILRERFIDDKRRKHLSSSRRNSLKQSQESLKRNLKNKQKNHHHPHEGEFKPLINKDSCFKSKWRITSSNYSNHQKVSKRNELYPITSIEDIEALAADKKSPTTTESKKVEDEGNEQMTMKIDHTDVKHNGNSQNCIENEVVNNQSDAIEISDETKHHYFVTNDNNTIRKNNNLKLSSLNRQLLSNTIVTSLSNCVTSQYREDSLTSLTNSSSMLSSKIENNLSMISLDSSQMTPSNLVNNLSMISLDTSSMTSLKHDTNLSASLRNNESAISLNSYNPSNASSMSDITLFNYYQEPPVVSYFIHDDYLRSYVDKDLVASLNIKGNIPEEPTTSLKAKDRYVRISLGSYNGIENVHVCNPKAFFNDRLNSLEAADTDNVTDRNAICDKFNCDLNESKTFSIDSCSSQNNIPIDNNATHICKVKEIVELISHDNSFDSFKETIIGETSPAIENNTIVTIAPVDHSLDKTDGVENNYISKIENKSVDENITIQTEETNKIDNHTSTSMCNNVNEKCPCPTAKSRLYKKHYVYDDKRKQFYENERRKSNDSKSSSNGDGDAIQIQSQYYRNMQIFGGTPQSGSIKDNHRTDLIISKSGGVKPFHHSSTRSSLRSTSSSLVNSLRHRISNASLFRYKEETRAAKISISVIIMALLSWLPFTILLLLRSSIFKKTVKYDSYDSFTIEKLAILFLCLNYVISPFLFAHRNKKIQKEIKIILKSIFCFWKKTNNEEQRLRNSFYNDYYVNKMRIAALKEKQRIENQMKKMVNVETMTTDELLISDDQQQQQQHNKKNEVTISIEDDNNVKSDCVKIDMEENENHINNIITPTQDKNFSFLNKLLEMKLKIWQSNKPLCKNAKKSIDTQRSSISSNTVSTSTTDVCCDV